MYRIRFHGRGGQGMKTASRILGTAFAQGRCKPAAPLRMHCIQPFTPPDFRRFRKLLIPISKFDELEWQLNCK